MDELEEQVARLEAENARLAHENAQLAGQRAGQAAVWLGAGLVDATAARRAAALDHAYALPATPLAVQATVLDGQGCNLDQCEPLPFLDASPLDLAPLEIEVPDVDLALVKSEASSPLDAQAAAPLDVDTLLMDIDLDALLTPAETEQTL